MRAYYRAILDEIGPTDVVLDLGTGSGVLALWAAQAGARHVYAVEPHGVIEVARRLAAANGLADRITFVHADLRHLTPADLGSPIDLLLSEPMGNFFVTDCMQPVLRHARGFLRDGARTLPRSIALELAATTQPLPQIDFWAGRLGALRLDAALPLALQEACFTHLAPHELVTAPQFVATFALVEAPSIVDGRVGLTVTRPGIMTAIAGWFRADLGHGHVLSTGPSDATATHWGQLVLPVAAVAVEVGDLIEAAVRVDLIDATLPRNAFAWEVVVRRGAAVVAEFRGDTEWLYPRGRS